MNTHIHTSLHIPRSCAATQPHSRAATPTQPRSHAAAQPRSCAATQLRSHAAEIPWFKGKDVATSLEYANPKKAVLHHVDDEDKKTLHELLQGVTATVTPLNRQPHKVYINESGLYCLFSLRFLLS